MSDYEIDACPECELDIKVILEKHQKTAKCKYVSSLLTIERLQNELKEKEKELNEKEALVSTLKLELIK